MKCPLCVDETLTVTHRGGIELDVCPRCRGIWLDRGELDRLLGDEPLTPPTTAAAPLPPPAPGPGPAPRPVPERGQYERPAPVRRDDDRRYERDDRYPRDAPDERYGPDERRRRKKRFGERLGDLFEDVLDL